MTLGPLSTASSNLELKILGPRISTAAPDVRTACNLSPASNAIGRQTLSIAAGPQLLQDLSLHLGWDCQDMGPVTVTVGQELQIQAEIQW